MSRTDVRLIVALMVVLGCGGEYTESVVTEAEVAAPAPSDESSGSKGRHDGGKGLQGLDAASYNEAVFLKRRDLRAFGIVDANGAIKSLMKSGTSRALSDPWYAWVNDPTIDEGRLRRRRQLLKYIWKAVAGGGGNEDYDVLKGTGFGYISGEFGLAPNAKKNAWTAEDEQIVSNALGAFVNFAEVEIWVVKASDPANVTVPAAPEGKRWVRETAVFGEGSVSVFDDDVDARAVCIAGSSPPERFCTPVEGRTNCGIVRAIYTECGSPCGTPVGSGNALHYPNCMGDRQALTVYVAQ